MIITNYFFIFNAKYLYLLAGGIALFWFLKLPREKKNEVVIFSAITLPIMFVVLQIVASLYFDPRPFVVGNFTPLVLHNPDNGFPSDHVLLVSAIASIIFPFSKKIASVIFAMAVLIGISRVYVGIHHPIDIVGSIIIAGVIAMLMYPVFEKIAKKHIIS